MQEDETEDMELLDGCLSCWRLIPLMSDEDPDDIEIGDCSPGTSSMRPPRSAVCEPSPCRFSPTD